MNADGQDASGSSDILRHPPRRRNHRNHTQTTPSSTTGLSESQTPAQTDSDTKPPTSRTEPTRNRRGAKFNSSLTETALTSTAVGSRSASVKPSDKYRSSAPKADDLTSRLIHELRTHPYPDCLICFAAIHPAQPTWSCSPSSPIALSTDDDSDGANAARRAGETAQCCWSTFHLKCIRQWAAKSVKDVVEAWRARGEERSGEWRCPGCQSKRMAVPSGYWYVCRKPITHIVSKRTLNRCFCGSTPDPKPPRLSTPHSCANPCSRPRVCGHPCPLACHPGPCPPCQVTTQLPCHGGHKTMSFRCANLAPGKANGKAAAELSCGRTCGRMLGCENHKCEEVCHPGACPPCRVREVAKCYCGKEEKDLECGVGEEKQCAVVEDGLEKQWLGRFTCDNLCERAFDCGVHHCTKPCHPPSTTPAPCPRSPSLVTHCPCGKHALSPSSAAAFPPGTHLNRTSCSDPIPTCESICMKQLEGCSHACAVRCHTGPCPPCTIMLVRPCRCGSTTRDVRCAEDQARASGTMGIEEILCDKPCGALRACGRHQCNRVCCPLASLASALKGKGKGKKRAGADSSLVDESGWHECDLVCGKMLGCGNHHCEQRDHRGVCPPCLRSSFEEMICHCGRTILEPPIPCGTRINCHYPCSRPPPSCGHPKAQHACHEDPIPCPPCPFLASKRCACGKKTVDNVRCSQEKISCGTACGKLLSCGFHHCDRLCHGDACGPCTAVCGKPRKLCLPAHHPCTLPCHAPASCSESEPCRAIINLTCPCGRIRQPVACGRSTSNAAGREGSLQLKCSNECLVAKRNARLAEALGINPDRAGNGDKQVVYSDDLLAFARANTKFCLMVEKSFADFLSSDKKSQILAPMPEARRNFVHDLAVVYRMNTQMVDQEPNRSVQLLRRIDSRIPPQLLSAAIAASSSASGSANLGKLADLRAPAMQQLPRPRASPAPSLTPPVMGNSSGVAWRAVVARQPQAGLPQSAWGVSSGSQQVPPTDSSSRAPTSAPPSRPSSIPPTATVNARPIEVPDNWEDD